MPASEKPFLPPDTDLSPKMEDERFNRIKPEIERGIRYYVFHFANWEILPSSMMDEAMHVSRIGIMHLSVGTCTVGAVREGIRWGRNFLDREAYDAGREDALLERVALAGSALLSDSVIYMGGKKDDNRGSR